MVLELELPPLELPLLGFEDEEGDDAEFVAEGADPEAAADATKGFVSEEMEAEERSNVN